MKRLKTTCVQCQQPMEHYWQILSDGVNIPFCTNPECPNYGLLQVGEEGIHELQVGSGKDNK